MIKGCFTISGSIDISSTFCCFCWPISCTHHAKQFCNLNSQLNFFTLHLVVIPGTSTSDQPLVNDVVVCIYSKPKYLCHGKMTCKEMWFLYSSAPVLCVRRVSISVAFLVKFVISVLVFKTYLQG